MENMTDQDMRLVWRYK